MPSLLVHVRVRATCVLQLRVAGCTGQGTRHDHRARTSTSDPHGTSGPLGRIAALHILDTRLGVCVCVLGPLPGMSSVVCPKSGSQVSHHVHSVAVCHRPTSEAAHGIRDSALYVYSMCTPPPPPHPALSDLELVPVFQLSRRRHNVKVNLNRRRALVQRSHDTSPDSSPEY